VRRLRKTGKTTFNVIRKPQLLGLRSALQCFYLDGAWYWIVSLLMASTAAMWVVFDARYRGKPLVRIVQLIVMGLWPIAVPIYLIATRGVRGLAWTILNLVGLVLANFIGYHSTILAVWGPESL